MKKNAQKILLCLFSFTKNNQVVFSMEQLRMAVPDMSEGGYRSLILFLERKGWLIKESLPGKQYLSITDKGREALKAKFPALNDKWTTWTGEWHAMTFIQAPASDPQFRYLRQLVLSAHALPLTRGVYLSAGSFSPEILSVCSSLYQNHIAIFSIGSWEFGMNRPIIIKYYDLASIASIYSSISTSIDGLLINFKNNKNTTDQQKMTISTTIDRLWSGLKEDPGFTAHYFPGLLDLSEIIKKVQLLLLI